MTQLIGPQQLPVPDPGAAPDVVGDLLALAQRLKLMLPFPVTDLDGLAPYNASDYESARIHVDELNCDFIARDGVWVQDGIAKFADAAARTSAYAKASAAYLLAGLKSTLTTRAVAGEPATVIDRYNGSAWKAWESDWISQSDPLSGVSPVTQVADYKYQGGDLRMKGLATITGAPTIGTVALTSPVALVTTRGNAINSGLLFIDAGTANIPAYATLTASTTITLLAMLTSGTYAGQAAPSSSIPFTWVSTDSIQWDLLLEVA